LIPAPPAGTPDAAKRLTRRAWLPPHPKSPKVAVHGPRVRAVQKRTRGCSHRSSVTYDGWDTATLRSRRALPGHEGRITCPSGESRS
jgi:hypothetical protein